MEGGKVVRVHFIRRKSHITNLWELYSRTPNRISVKMRVRIQFYEPRKLSWIIAALSPIEREKESFVLLKWIALIS